MKYLVVDDGAGERIPCDTLEDALEAANESIRACRETADSDGEWPDYVTDIYVMRVVQRVRLEPVDGEDSYDAVLREEGGRDTTEHRQTISAGMARARRVEKTGRHFIVIAEDEPYFAHAYGLVRDHEKGKETWTQQDEDAYRRLTGVGG